MALKKRSDGRYQVSIQDGINPETGKPQRKVFYGETQKEAKQKRDEYIRNREIGLKQNRKLTVADWAAKWLAVYGTGGYSVTRSNELAVRKLTAFMGDKVLAEVVKSDVQRFADTVKEMSFSSVKKIQMTVQNVFREAVADRLIVFDPTLKVEWGYASKGSHRALAEWEVDLITQHWREHRFGILVMLMLYGGLRRGEVLALTWGDITDDTIHVTRALHFENNIAVMGDMPKTEAGIRDIPIFSAALRQAIAEMRGAPDESIAASCCAAGRLTERAFERGWKGFNAAMQNILNGRTAIRPGQRNDLIAVQQVFAIRAHDLRHTFCTMIVETGIDLKTVQKLMGHADETMIMEVYNHLRDRLEAKSIDKLRAAFS